MALPGRKFSSGGEYRYGFNGQEKDDEIRGNGNTNTAEFWEYDTRTARRWNLDPNPQISFSDYSAFGNNPIFYIDILGDEFTPSAQKAADELSAKTAKLREQDKKSIKDYSQSKGMKKLHKNDIKQLKNKLKEYDKVDNEIKKLSNSKQVYDVKTVGEVDFDGKTSFDPVSGHIVMTISKEAYATNPITALANEFKHSYQFEVGAISFISGGLSDRGGMLLDSYDEYESDKRDKLLNNSPDYETFTLQTYLDGQMTQTTIDFKTGAITKSYLRPTGPLNLNSKNSAGKSYKSLLKAQLKSYNSSTIEFEVMKGWEKYTKIIPFTK